MLGLEGWQYGEGLVFEDTRVWAGQRLWCSLCWHVASATSSGDRHWWFGCLIVMGRAEGCVPVGLCVHTSTVHPLLYALEHTGHLHCQGAGPPGAPLDPSLTQADRFLLVFRVCFCLAPFEIGYDVGGKAAASKPHTKCAQQQPVVSWKMDGQRVGRKVTLLLHNFFHCICDTLLQR